MSKFSGGAEPDLSVLQEAQALASNIAGSIPFYLAENIETFFNQALVPGTTSHAMTPGPSVGGLLSMHTMYLLAKLAVVDPELREYLKDCLVWVGRNMGIGQATMLSEVKSMARY